MNGVHDMGGMQDMGPVSHEKDEPVFHAAWEGRVYALNRAAAAGGKWNLDASRYEIEKIPPADYLRMSYYECWYVRLVELLIKRDMVTRAEIESGRPASGSPKANPAMNTKNLPSVFVPANPERPKAGVSPRFSVGQQVRARNMHPTHHTRLPRYARGKQGTIQRDHGIFLFADTNAHFAGENPQHVYSVCFAARELWGSQASARDSVYLDMWDDYLELV
jgi:nitrile hydratase beta subunit